MTIHQAQLHNKEKKKKGFSFIETLVAITLLLTAVVAPLSLAQDGIVAARLAQDQIVAFYLGQEGIELVKNLRDHNRLNNDSAGQLGSPVNGNLAGCIVTGPNDASQHGCVIDATNISNGNFVAQGCSGTCSAIRVRPEGKTEYSYRPSGTVDSKYTRTIKVWYPNASTQEAVVEVVVSWPFGKLGTIKEYKVKNYLYNW